MTRVNFIPEPYAGSASQTTVPEQTILPDDGNRPSALEHRYGKKSFTERQENFYRNLLAMYRASGSKKLPVYFETAHGKAMRFDRGCISMAFHDGFLAPLADDADGVLRYVRLGW
jgi:hypothetical protein